MANYLNRLLDVNVRYKGADHILTKVANLTAANGLLGRSPLADRRVVDASFAIPPEHKLAGSVEKAVLKAAVADLLPAEIVHRPKSGMLVPVQAWFAGELRAYARDLLLDRRARTRPYLAPGGRPALAGHAARAEAGGEDLAAADAGAVAAGERVNGSAGVRKCGSATETEADVRGAA